MKLAFQTICFGDLLAKSDWPAFLAELRRAGYSGVEIFQRPDKLPDWKNLKQLAIDAGIEILGFSGGDLVSRMEYLRGKALPGLSDEDFKRRKEPYLYLEDWAALGQDGRPVADIAEEKRFRLALHYHHLCRLTSFEEARKLLKDHPNVEWLPDTAHLFIGKQRTDAVIQMLLDSELQKRTFAIHLKDWTPVFGRFSHRFAKGFCPLGEGSVGVEPIVQSIGKQTEWNPWIVVEIDRARQEPMLELVSSSRKVHKWLNEEFEISKSEFKATGHASIECIVPIFRSDELLQLAAQADKAFYTKLADWLFETSNALDVVLCSIITSQGKATIRGRTVAKLENWIERDTAKGIACQVVQAHEVQTQKLNENESIVAVPILNPYNANLIRSVSVYKCNTHDSDRLLKLVGHPSFQRSLSNALDLHVAGQCQRVAAEAAHLASKHDKKGPLLEALAKMLKESLDCEGVTIFTTSFGVQLDVGGTTGIRWAPENHYYPFGKGLTGRAAQHRHYRIYRHDERDEKSSRSVEINEDRRSTEVVEKTEVDSILVSCFFNSKDQVAGVVRCRNLLDADGSVLFFSEDDLSLVEATMISIQPILERMMEDELCLRAFALLSHELSTPIKATKNTVLRIQKDLGYFGKLPGRPMLQRDHFETIDTLMNIMVRTLNEYELTIADGSSNLQLNRQPVKFIGDVLRPCLALSRFILQQRGFAITKIDYGNDEEWKKIPELFVDRSMFEQIVFNLIENAIKYADREPKNFGVRVSGERVPNGVNLYFEDDGVGIPIEHKDWIFTRGGRVPSKRKVSGHGLGLWIVKRLVEAHGGSIELVQFRGYGPTKFKIWLPTSAISTQRP